jgi:hypothetical protein
MKTRHKLFTECRDTSRIAKIKHLLMGNAAFANLLVGLMDPVINI